MKPSISRWLTRYALFYYAAIVFLILTWFILKSVAPTIRIISALSFAVTMILFKRSDRDDTQHLFSKVIDWINISLVLFFTILYIAISVGDISIAISLLLLGFTIVLVGSIVLWLLALWRLVKNQELLGVIISYLVISILVIVLFGFFFALSDALPENSIQWTNAHAKGMTASDFVYFSATAYYSSGVGDIQPVGTARWLMLGETASSYLFHVIIMGFAVNSLFNDRKKNDRKKSRKS